MLIRELDSNKKFIKSFTLSAGDEYTPSDKAEYLAIGIYKSDYESGMTYQGYKNLFNNGFYAKLAPVVENTGDSSADTDSTVSTLIEDSNMDDLNSWMSGIYNWTDGTYTTNTARICLTEYKTFKNKNYTVEISDASYKMIIRELDSNHKFIKSVTLATGNDYVPSASAVYLAVGIYNASNEWGISYSKYETMFANGFYARLNVKGSSNQDTEEKVYTSYREELKDMLESGDMTTHDVSKYNMTYAESQKIYNELATGECYLAVHAYNSMFVSSTRNSGGIIQTVYLYNADNNFKQRYLLLKENVNKALSLLDSKMNDVEKTLVLHDYIVEHTKYTTGANMISCAEVLAYGRGVCQGYAYGLMVLLHEAGIESKFISSNSMNHGWLMVELDGELYHVDPTWDDTRTRVSGQVDHDFFIRNDNEFKHGTRYSHSGWVSYTYNAVSTSKKYEDWFVHDVVGKMLYEDGFWYYAEENMIKKSKIDGSEKSTVVEENSSVEMVSLENGVVSYKASGQTKSISIN